MRTIDLFPLPLRDGRTLPLPALKPWSTRDRWVDLREVARRRAVLAWLSRHREARP